MYRDLPQSVAEQNGTVARLYTEWLAGKHSDKARALLHTQYHALEKNDVALNIKWWKFVP